MSTTTPTPSDRRNPTPPTGTTPAGAPAQDGTENTPRPEWSEGYAGVVDRRLGIDRRILEGGFSGLERRRGAGRRLSDSQRAAEEGHMTQEQFLFLVAIDEFKKANQTQFPTWSDVLEVIRLLGYRKTCRSELNLTRAEDWQEAPLAPSNVRPPRWAERFANRKRPAA